MEESKERLCKERRSFDPEILNFTLTTMQKSISQHAKITAERFNELKAMITVIQEENRIKNNEINRVDKEFSVCRASKAASSSTEDQTHSKRNAILFNILTIVTAAGALAVSVSNYFRGFRGE